MVEKPVLITNDPFLKASSDTVVIYRGDMNKQPGREISLDTLKIKRSK